MITVPFTWPLTDPLLKGILCIIAKYAYIRSIPLLYLANIGVTLQVSSDWLSDMLVIKHAHSCLAAPDHKGLSERIIDAQIALEQCLECTSNVTLTSKDGQDLKPGIDIEFFAYDLSSETLILRVIYNPDTTNETIGTPFDDIFNLTDLQPHSESYAYIVTRFTLQPCIATAVLPLGASELLSPKELLPLLIQAARR